MHKRESVVVSLDIEPRGFTESNRLTHVRHGQRWGHIAAADALVQPSDADATHFDLVMTQQRRDHRLVALFPTAGALHRAILRPTASNDLPRPIFNVVVELLARRPWRRERPNDESQRRRLLQNLASARLIFGYRHISAMRGYITIR